MECYLCNSQDIIKRDGKVRDNSSLSICECNNCGLVFLSDFSHINESFYENSKMSSDDLNIKEYILQHDVDIDTNRRLKFLDKMIKNKSLLEFGSGSGQFLLEAKKISRDVTGIELDDRFNEVYTKNNILKFKNIDSLPKDSKFDFIALFHVLEHLPDPIEILKQLSLKLSIGGKIIIEVPNSSDALLTIYKSQAFSEFTYWSCHLFLFNQYTLELLAKKSGLRVIFVKYIQRYPLSNHLYWLSFNKPGGHKQWSNFIDSELLNSEYENQLAAIGATDTIFAMFEKI